MKSVFEISAAKLQSNIAVIQHAVGHPFEILAVVKADAYGHGAVLLAPALVNAGMHWLGVGDCDEGVLIRGALRAAGLSPATVHSRTAVRILVMCGFEPADAATIVAAELTPVVWTAGHVMALEQAASVLGQAIDVHLEVDTGMARQGAAPGVELAAVLDAIRDAVWVRCEGVFSHLSSSEVVGGAETARQQDRFATALDQIAAAGVRPRWVHLGNSSALDEGSTLGWIRERARIMGAAPMVRPGLALYGYALPLEPGSATGSLRHQLQPIATWKTRVIGLKSIAVGERVGYGATFVAVEPMRLALLPVGYADGFRREASSGVGDGWVMIDGRRAPVVGRVSMNLAVVDITGRPGVREGDEVVLLGEGVSAEEHARWCGTLPYEILCGIGSQPRLV